MRKNLHSIRTDLAVECLNEKETFKKGISHHTETVKNILVTRVIIETKEASEKLNKPIGKFITIETTPFYRFTSDFKNQVEVVSKELEKLLPKGLILVVGLGNSSITPDALGPEVIELIFTTRHLKSNLKELTGFEHLRSTTAIAPGVLGQTGIETAEIIKGIINEIKPDGVIVIDALASRELVRLGATVQISDTGITPGSGVANHRKALTKDTLGIPVISIGVPTVVDINTIAENFTGNHNIILSPSDKNMMVTPREIDTIIENAAKTIAFGINKALQPTLSIDEIISLVN